MPSSQVRPLLDLDATAALPVSMEIFEADIPYLGAILKRIRNGDERASARVKEGEFKYVTCVSCG